MHNPNMKDRQGVRKNRAQMAVWFLTPSFVPTMMFMSEGSATLSLHCMEMQIDKKCFTCLDQIFCHL